MYAYRKPPRMRKMTWALTGVWVRGLTWLTARGSAPSIDIATATRVQPTMTLKTTWSALSRIPMIIKNRMIGLSVRTIARLDRKSTRLNSSHGYISYAVFCLKKKTKARRRRTTAQPIGAGAIVKQLSEVGLRL